MTDTVLDLWPLYEAVTDSFLFAPAFPYQTLPVYVSLGQISEFVTAPAVTVVSPASGGTVAMSTSWLFVDTALLAALTIKLPASSGAAEICFAAPVTTLTIQTAAGGAVAGSPTSAYGPGAAIQFRFINGLWRYWK